MESIESTKQIANGGVASQYCKINIAVGKFRIAHGPGGNKCGAECAIECWADLDENHSGLLCSRANIRLRMHKPANTHLRCESEDD